MGGQPRGGLRNTEIAGGVPFFAPFTLNATTSFVAQSMGPRLYMNRYCLNLGNPGANNVFQIKFLQPLVDQYFNARGGDKIDAVSRQNWYDLVLKWTDVLVNLNLQYMILYLNPSHTPSDTAFGAPFTRESYDALMEVMEQSGIMVPCLAVNLAKLYTIIFQVGPGNIPERARPSYLMPLCPARALTGTTAGTTYPSELGMAGSMETVVNSLLAEYDSRIYAVQASLPGLRFNRALVENIKIFHPISNFGEVIGKVWPFAKDVSTSETEYYAVCDGTTSLSVISNLNGLSDLWAITPLFRLSSSSNGGSLVKLPITTDKLGISYVALNGSGTGWTDLTNPSYCISAIFRNLSEAQGMLLHNTAFLGAMHSYELTTPLASADAWNMRAIAFLLRYGFVTQPFTWAYKGFAPTADIAFTPSLGTGFGNAVSNIPAVAPSGQISKWSKGKGKKKGKRK